MSQGTNQNAEGVLPTFGYLSIHHHSGPINCHCGTTGHWDPTKWCL